MGQLQTMMIIQLMQHHHQIEKLIKMQFWKTLETSKYFWKQTN